MNASLYSAAFLVLIPAIAFAWITYNFVKALLVDGRGLLAVRATELAKPPTETVSIFLGKEELRVRLVVLGLLLSFLVGSWRIPAIGAVMLLLFGPWVLLLIGQIRGEWCYMRGKHRTPVLHLSAYGLKIRQEVQVPWAQIVRAEVQVVGFGRLRAPYLVLGLQHPWRTGELARNLSKRCEFCTPLGPKGDYVLPLKTLEDWATPDTVLELIRTRMAHAVAAP
ncbi:hypothetical protein [Hydrogenophaga sp.]|uniref:hypothetical protein n=1 Tax=Hydrogenophaga sp. TaxID=1904254 RepID=UPI002FCBCF5D